MHETELPAVTVWLLDCVTTIGHPGVGVGEGVQIWQGVTVAVAVAVAVGVDVAVAVGVAVGVGVGVVGHAWAIFRFAAVTLPVSPPPPSRIVSVQVPLICAVVNPPNVALSDVTGAGLT